MVLKSDRISHLITQFYPHFLTNTFCHTHSSNSSRLSTPNFSLFSKSLFIKILSYLCSFSTTSLTNYNQNIVISACLDQFTSILEYRQMLFLFLNSQITWLEVFSWLWFYRQCLVKYFVKISHFVFILLLSYLTTLFCVLDCIHSRTIKCAFRISNNSNRRKVDSGFSCLTCQKRRLSIIDLNISFLDLFFSSSLPFFLDTIHIIHSAQLPRICVSLVSLIIYLLFIL